MLERLLVAALFNLVVLLLCLWRPNWGRIFLGLFFIVMAIGVHIVLVLTAPVAYLALPDACVEVVRCGLCRMPFVSQTYDDDSARELYERFENALVFAVNGEAESMPPGAEEPEAGTPTLELLRPAPAYDPDAIVHHMEAWMPDAIASRKLRGFVQDFGGEVIESVPGCIRVRLGGDSSSLSWLGFRRKTAIIDMELRLERAPVANHNTLHITVIMNAPDRKTALNAEWRHRCNQVFCDLRGYLVGSSVG